MRTKTLRMHFACIAIGENSTPVSISRIIMILLTRSSSIFVAVARTHSPLKPIYSNIIMRSTRSKSFLGLHVKS